MKISLTLLLVLCLWSCNDPATTSKPQKNPPNLILIIADDMAWDDCGAYGHPSIQTPNIDQLAKDGMLFHQAFLTTSSCSPSRSSIITGKYPHQTNAEQLHWPLPADNITFVEKLKDAGYWTAQAGKWHLGDFIKDRFDFIAPRGSEGLVSDNNQEQINDGSGCQQWVPTLQNRPKDKPFFLWLAAVDPHRPYDNTDSPIHSTDDVRVPPYFPDNQKVREDFARYYDEIHRMDRYIGEVVATLDREELSENTVILVISDNGRPFPRDKTTLYDGGIKTPWIVKWPAKIKKASQTNALVSSVDIAPTFLSLAGITSDGPWEGKDFSPTLTDPNHSFRDYVYAEDHWHDFEDYTRAVRTQKYKYIRNFYPDLPNTPPADALRSPTFESMLELLDKNQLNTAKMACFRQPRPAEELFDTEADPFELNNLAQNPEFATVLEQMQEKMDEIRTKTNDQLPERRTADEFDRVAGTPLPNRKMPRPSKKELGFELF